MIKRNIQELIKRNQEITTFRDKLKFDEKNPDDLILQLIEQLSRTNYNSALGLKLAHALQLSNDKKVFEQYELEDIRDLFTSLLTISDNDLGLYVESAHFEWAVMDNGVKAKAIITKGLEKANKHVEELKKILAEID